MVLAEILLASLCLNATCENDANSRDLFDASLRKQQLFNLATELSREQLRVTTLENENLSGVKNGTGVGVAFELFNILQRKFGFNYTITKPKKNTWGSNKDGVLNMLRQNDVDMAVAFLPVLPQYTHSVDYSPSLDTGEWVVLMKRPKESATGSGLLAPFTLPVWLLILVSLAVIGPVVCFIMWVQAKLWRDDSDKFTLPQCVWFVYGALLKQGTTLNPLSDTARLLFSTWWIFITILTAFYTANLTAFLTLSKFTLPINQAKDIGAKKSKWVTTQGNALEDAMKLQANGYANDTSEFLRELGEPQNYLTPGDQKILANHVLHRDMLFIREKPIVEYLMYEDYKLKARAEIDESDRCTFVITKFSVATFSRAFAYANDFKYKPLFDTAIRNMVEGGIIKYKLREDLPDAEICPLNLGNKERQLRNADLVVTYDIVGGGFVLSLLVFIIEMIIRWKDVQPLGSGSTNHSLLELFKNYKPRLFDPPINNNHEKFHGFQQTKFVTPPPSYHTLFNPPADSQNIKKKNINGREYWVYDSNNGGQTLMPLRTPSALLFQYTN